MDKVFTLNQHVCKICKKKKKCLVVFFKNVQFLIFIILDSHIVIDLLVNRTQELLCPSFATQETNRKQFPLDVMTLRLRYKAVK